MILKSHHMLQVEILRTCGLHICDVSENEGGLWTLHFTVTELDGLIVSVYYRNYLFGKRNVVATALGG